MQGHSQLMNILPPHETPVTDSNALECNFPEMQDEIHTNHDAEEFELIALGATDELQLYGSNRYCSKWRERGGLHLSKDALIKRSYAHRKEFGLFSLFLNNSFLNCVRIWTSAELVKRGKGTKQIRMDELLAYIGLELATSVHKLNRLKDYWSSNEVLGIPYFKKVMGRDAFLNIRSALRLYPLYEEDVALRDPLWHRRQLLEHYVRNSASLAVPVGVSTLDENTVRCKGRTRARSYMKSKPLKFGIRFYAVVGWSHAYLHTLQDNGSGNKTGQSPVERYTNIFRELRGAVYRKVDGNLVAKSSTSALWCTQIAHQTKMHPTPAHGRLIITDNFYTHHVLARQLERLSDGECKVLGTVRFNNTDGINRPALKEGIASLKHAKRGEWCLVQFYERKKASSTVSVAKNAGFVIFKDRSVVTFYTNDLADTPKSRIQKPDDHAVSCVHGLAPLPRWTGDESMSRTILRVPSVIVAYNLFMNGVDRFDQLRSTSATVRKERRVPMSLLTFILDASIINSHALLNDISKKKDAIIDVMTMKHRLIEQLVAQYVEYKQRRTVLKPIGGLNHDIP